MAAHVGSPARKAGEQIEVGILGVTGMVGSHLADFLLEKTDWEIVGLCRCQLMLGCCFEMMRCLAMMLGGLMVNAMLVFGRHTKSPWWIGCG